MPAADLRVLVVDDSVAVRRSLGDALEREPGFTVCGSAPNGLLALELLAKTRPDVIVLDLEMPVMDGLEFLSRLRPTHPRLPVLVFSGVVGHANEATLEALWRGASDYLLKPTGLTPERTADFLRAELFPRLRALGSSGPATQRPGSAAPARPVVMAPSAPIPFVPGPDPVPSVVVVGASTGGPRALASAIGSLPLDFPVPLVVVQHMPAEMSDFFAAGLGVNCELPVRIATDGAAVTPGVIWVAAGGAHLKLVADGPRARFAWDRGPEVNGCRPAVDPLFLSATQVYGAGVLAVVLTGMGQDGLVGARAVHDAGGTVIVQDEASSVIWGMPGSIARAGFADHVLPLDAIAAEIVARCERGRRHAA